MSDELEANPAPEEEVTPAPEFLDTKAAAEPDEGADEEDDDTDELAKLAGLEAVETSDAEPVEVEYEGKTYTVAPELKDALLRQSDYTKKTMTLAEERKAVEARQAQIEELGQISQEERAALVQAAAIRLQIEQLENTPIDGMSREQLNELRLNHSDLTRQAESLEKRAQEAGHKANETRTQQFAKAREEVLTKTAKIIPNFDDQRRTELEAFAVTLGASPDEVQRITDPTVYKTLHLADIGAKFIERQRKAANVKANQQAAPVEMVGKKARVAKDPNKESPEEYHARRIRERARA